MHLLSTALAAGVLFLGVDWLVSRRAAVLAVLVLVSLPWRPLALEGHAFVHGPFTAAVPRLAYALAPWTGLVPFALVRGRSGGRLVLGGAAVALLAIESVLPVTTPVLVVLAGVVGAMLADLDASPPDALLALGILVIELLVGRDLPALKWVTACTAGTATLALLAEASWLPVRRSLPIAAVATLGGLVLRAKGH